MGTGSWWHDDFLEAEDEAGREVQTLGKLHVMWTVRSDRQHLAGGGAGM